MDRWDLLRQYAHENRLAVGHHRALHAYQHGFHFEPRQQTRTTLRVSISVVTHAFVRHPKDILRVSEVGP